MNDIVVRNISFKYGTQYEIYLHFFDYFVKKLEEKLNTKSTHCIYSDCNNIIQKDMMPINCRYIAINGKKLVIDFSDVFNRISGISLSGEDYIKNDSVKVILKTIVCNGGSTGFNLLEKYSFYKNNIFDFWFFPYRYFYKNVISDIDSYKYTESGYDLFGVYGPSTDRQNVINEINKYNIHNGYLKCLDHKNVSDKSFLSINDYYKKSFSSKINLVMLGQGICSYQRFYDTAFAGCPCMMVEPFTHMSVKPVPYIHYYPINPLIRIGKSQEIRIGECKKLVSDYYNLIENKEMLATISGNAREFANDNLTYDKMCQRLLNILETQGIL
jgi:hypothetical protein